ncbi:MAG: PAS domain S-box protein [Cyclobacteriaceae bacterium]|nr:PAS domain S-box protein [Cyclobacteriaceae bacterium]
MGNTAYDAKNNDLGQRIDAQTDLDALKQELADLKAEHDLLKEKFEIYDQIAEEGLFIHENFVIKETNKAFEKLTGYSRQELMGMHGKEMLTPESLLLLKANVNNPSTEVVEVDMITKDGRILPVQTKGKSFVLGGVTRRAGLVQNISEINKARKKLEESEEKHRLISSLLSDYVYTCTIIPGETPHLGWVSGAMEKICGYSSEELASIKGGWFSIIHPEDVARIADSINTNYADNKFYENEYRIIDKHGQTRWLMDRSMLIDYNEGTRTLTLLGATKDITEKKKIEEDLLQRNLDYKRLNEDLKLTNKKLSEVNNQLTESEWKYKNLVESFAQGIGISRGETILFANKALLDIYGLDSFEEFCSKKLTDYMTPKSRKEVKSRLRNYDRNIPQGPVFRYNIIRKDGAIRTLEIVSNELTHEDTLCRQVIITDITPRLETEDALARAAHIFENIQLGLLIYKLENLDDDRSLKLITANPASEAIFGISQKDVMGKYIDDIFPNLRINRIPQQYAEVVRSKIPVDIDDIYYEDERISETSFSVKVFPLPNQCVGVSFKNVSKRRLAEQELRIRNHELNNFVYKVSHDLRAPLSSIKGLIHLSKLENHAANHLPLIENRINHLDGFIRDILSHSRNLNTAVIIERLHLKQIMSDCIAELEYLSGADTISKNVTISGTVFYNDKIRIYEICRNMISNAIKYQDKDKAKPYLKVVAHTTPKSATIIFEDNGIGIENAYLQNIFDMFYRATDLGEGSGIGLYIVNQAIEKLGGKVLVTSRSGIGTTFTVVLPNMIGRKQQT